MSDDWEYKMSNADKGVPQGTMKKIINIPDAPKAVGPYSQGVNYNDLFFFSGQIAIDPQNSKLIEGDVVAQTKQVFKNIDALLKSQNLTAQNVIKTTVFLTNLSAFAEVNAEYAKYFSSAPPARSCVEVSKLPLGALVEIEIIAAK